MSDDRPKRIEFTVSDELWDRINAARGFEPRASFVKRALEAALRVCSCGATGFGDERARRHGSGCMFAPEKERESRAPVEKEQPGPKVAPREPAAATVKKPDSRRTPSLKETWGR